MHRGDRRDRALPRSPADVLAIIDEHASSLIHVVRRDPEVIQAADISSLEWPRTRADVFDASRLAVTQSTRPRGFASALRLARHAALVRIALREVLGLADVDESSAEMAFLADALVSLALDENRRALIAESGEPTDSEGQPVPFVVLGMGKLGGFELNLGSDIDLCFFYGTDDATVRTELTAHEFFSRLASRTSRALSEVTEDGFCFRVDLRLRPEGMSGPLVNSLASAENYYATWGRTWERAAMLRARPIAGDVSLGRELLQMLAPWIFPREVDATVAGEMHALLARTRRELRVVDSDVKLGRGGIREVEFLVQTLQLMWGGQFPDLRVPGTIDALRHAVARGLVSEGDGSELENAWALLRRVEHRIHLQAGYQTHRVPPAGERLESFARSLGFETAAAFEHELAESRDIVRRRFDALIGPETVSEEVFDSLWPTLLARDADELRERAAATLGLRDGEEGAAHLLTLSRRAGSPLGAVTRERLPALGLGILRAIRDTPDPDRALRYTAQFFARLGDSAGYSQRLVEQPRLARRLIDLFGTSSTLSIALIGHPESVDLLLGGPTVPSLEDVRAAHARLRADSNGLPIDEFIRALRRLRRETTLHVGLAHVGRELDVDGVELHLTSLADAQIETALAFAFQETASRLGRKAGALDVGHSGLCVVGLGRLGAVELGFGGDLDLIFVYERATETEERHLDAEELFTRTAQLTLRLLSQSDAEGPGYPMDTRLRPSGSHGTLVVSLRAFEKYHATEAAPWERQALIRARCIAGDAALKATLDSRLCAIPVEGRAPSGEELANMRRRLEVELANESAERLHPKLGYGGMVDVEFLVQWLQMGHRERAAPMGHTLKALSRLEAEGVLSRECADELGTGYRFFRDASQALRLMDENREALLTRNVTSPLARWFGIRDRDGERKEQVLARMWRRHASRVRRRFEEAVAPVGTLPPWGDR